MIIAFPLVLRSGYVVLRRFGCMKFAQCSILYTMQKLTKLASLEHDPVVILVPGPGRRSTPHP